MSISNYINDGLINRDRENVDELQFQVLLHLEEGVPLSKELENKIQNLGNRFGFTRMQILTSIVSDQVAATKLAKSSTRQGLAEHLQIKYLREVRGFNINKLADNGIGSVRIYNGNFVLNSFYVHPGATKSIDALIGRDYISLKYVNESGGAQDNQIEDVKKFLVEACKYVKNRKNKSFTAIVDGAYIESKMSMLNIYTNDMVRVFNSDTYIKNENKHYKQLSK